MGRLRRRATSPRRRPRWRGPRESSKRAAGARGADGRAGVRGRCRRTNDFKITLTRTDSIPVATIARTAAFSFARSAAQRPQQGEDHPDETEVTECRGSVEDAVGERGCRGSGRTGASTRSSNSAMNSFGTSRKANRPRQAILLGTSRHRVGERRAVLAVGAGAAQRRGVRPEVLCLACADDRRPHRRRRGRRAPAHLLVGDRLDEHDLVPEIDEADLGRRAARRPPRRERRRTRRRQSSSENASRSAMRRSCSRRPP